MVGTTQTDHQRQGRLTIFEDVSTLAVNLWFAVFFVHSGLDAD